MDGGEGAKRRSNGGEGRDCFFSLNSCAKITLVTCAGTSEMRRVHCRRTVVPARTFFAKCQLNLAVPSAASTRSRQATPWRAKGKTSGNVHQPHSSSSFQRRHSIRGCFPWINPSSESPNAPSTRCRNTPDFHLENRWNSSTRDLMRRNRVYLSHRGSTIWQTTVLQDGLAQGYHSGGPAPGLSVSRSRQ